MEEGFQSNVYTVRTREMGGGVTTDACARKTPVGTRVKNLPPFIEIKQY